MLQLRELDANRMKRWNLIFNVINLEVHVMHLCLRKFTIDNSYYITYMYQLRRKIKLSSQQQCKKRNLIIYHEWIIAIPPFHQLWVYQKRIGLNFTNLLQASTIKGPFYKDKIQCNRDPRFDIFILMIFSKIAKTWDKGT